MIEAKILIIKKLLVAMTALLSLLQSQEAEKLKQPEPKFGALVQREDRMDWNVKSVEEVASNRFIADLRVKQVRYFDNDKWNLIDTKLSLVNGKWCADKMPFSVCISARSTEVSVMTNTNKYDVPKRKKIIEADSTLGFSQTGVTDVAGQLQTVQGGGLKEYAEEYVVYPNVYPQYGADLLYLIRHGRAPNFGRVIKFNDPLKIPAVNFEISFDYDFSDDPQIPMMRNKGGVTVKAPNKEKGFGLKTAKIWDSAGKKEDIFIRIEPLGMKKYRLTKEIPALFFTNATFPVYTDDLTTFNPDPDPETATVDGRVRRGVTSQSWSSLRGGTGVSIDDSSGDATGFGFRSSSVSIEYDFMDRGIWLFDTTVIEVGSTIGSSTFATRCSATNGSAFSQTTDMVGATTTSNTALNGGDFEGTVGNTQLMSDTQTAFASVSCSATAPYTHWVLNSNGRTHIKEGTITKFGMRASGDRTNTEPTWSSAVTAALQFLWAETTGTAEDPKLLVDYTLPSTASTIRPPPVFWFFSQ